MPTGPGVLQAGAGGNGSNVTFEDNTNVDAGGDGLYSWADIAAACVAKGFFAADGVTPAVSRATLLGGFGGISREIYFTLVTVQNGDGVGTTPTTLQDKNATVNFITGKTYIVSTVGTANRATKYGTELPANSGVILSKDGVDIYHGAAPFYRGLIQLAGCKFVAVGGMIFSPNVTGLDGRIINFIGEATGTIGLGSLTGELNYVFDVDFTTTVGGAIGLAQFNANYAEKLIIAAPNCQAIVRTAGLIKARDVRLVGGPGTIAEFHNTSSGLTWQLVDWIWGQYELKAPFPLPQIGAVEDWRSYGIRVMNLAGVPLPTKDWRVLDGNGNTVASGITNSEGQSSFGSGINLNAVAVRRILAGTTNDQWVDLGPFTTEVNYPAGPNHDTTYKTFSRTYTWPGFDYAYGRQLSPMFDLIHLEPSAPAPILIDSVEAVADGEIRILTEMSQAA